MTVEVHPKPSPKVPHWLIRTIWFVHRRAYAFTGGRFGLRTRALSSLQKFAYSELAASSGSTNIRWWRPFTSSSE